MRPACLVAFALISGVAFAQNSPTLARVKARAVVKAAPGDLSPDTGVLDPGGLVTVVAPEGADWLAVLPPSGSVSWINAVRVELPAAAAPPQPPFNAVVRADKGAEAPIHAGAVGVPRPLNVRRTKLPEGTIVQVIGAKVKAKADGDDLEMSWYPIVAPADDFRFVRRDAVELTGNSPAGFVVKAGASESKPLPGTQPPASADPAGGRNGDWTLSVPGGGKSKRDDFPNYHPTFRAAEQARGNNDIATAEKLYKQTADEVRKEGPNKDTDLANLCYDRIYLMKNGSRDEWNGAAWRPPTTPTQPKTELQPSADPLPRPSSPPPRAELPREEKKASTATAAGYLKPTRFKIGSRAAFVLTDSRGYTRHYVVSGGVDLDRYEGRWVEVSGEETKPDGMKDPVLVVSQITAAH